MFRFALSALFLIFLFSPSHGANAAAVVDPTGRSGEPPQLPQEFRPAIPTPGTLLPPIPLPPKGEPLPAVRVFVREIRITGSTVFSAEELAKIAAPYLNREVSSEDLEALRVALTLHYVNNGYVNSGVILPDQTLTDGAVTFQVIEGSLTRIELQGNRWFRSSYLQKRFFLDAGPPLNINDLQNRLQLLLEDSRIQRLNAELKPGPMRGESILDVRIEERTPYKLWLEFNNYQSPSVGEKRGIVTLEHQNLTGNGDFLTGRYGRSEGLDPLFDIKYSLPLTAYDTALSFQYRRNVITVIEQPFQALDINSKSNVYSIALRQPVYRTLSSEIALELIGERLSLATSLLGEQFSLEPGARNGKSVVSALRLGQEWVYRTQNQVIAARSRFSFGINALGATINQDGLPDGKFFAWLGQFQWVRRLGVLDSYAIFRSDLQLSDNPLLSLEQISVGGRFSVRGYRENTMLRDRALITSVETRLPLLRNYRAIDYVELAQFFDFGRGWNTLQKTPEPQDLSSVGVGVRWGLAFAWPVALRPQFEIYWGHRLRQVDRPGGPLQDHGIHLQFILGIF